MKRRNLPRQYFATLQTSLIILLIISVWLRFENKCLYGIEVNRGCLENKLETIDRRNEYTIRYK